MVPRNQVNFNDTTQNAPSPLPFDIAITLSENIESPNQIKQFDLQSDKAALFNFNSSIHHLDNSSIHHLDTSIAGVEESRESIKERNNKRRENEQSLKEINKSCSEISLKDIP